jgi:predicted molibdopterin-dependent oxidoreductase YjgC
VDCKRCPANKRCALQATAAFLGVGLGCKPFDRVLKEPEVDSRHPLFDYYPNRCILCGMCLRHCVATVDRVCLSFAGRGFDTVVGFFDIDPDTAARCSDCRACLAICPTGALVERSAESA